MLNGPADALSQMNGATNFALFSNFGPQPILWEAIRREYMAHPETMKLLNSLKEDPGHPNFVIREGILLFKGKVWIPTDSALQSLLLVEFHSTPTGGYARIHRTLSRISSIFYWTDLRRSIRDYVSRYNVCQATKPFN